MDWPLQLALFAAFTALLLLSRKFFYGPAIAELEARRQAIVEAQADIEQAAAKAAQSQAPQLRVARPTDRLDEVVAFYRDGLGFEVLGSFRDHAGFDGTMLGHPGWPYHLEFTREADHTVGLAPTQDHLLVLYFPDRAAHAAAVQRLRSAGYESVPAYNPYWDQLGVTFEDPDGYRVVIQGASWGGQRSVDGK